MSYDYKTIKPELFREDTQLLFLKIRENVLDKLDSSGAIRMSHAAVLPNGVGAADIWTMMACVDRMVELGEIREIGQVPMPAGQDRIFIRTRGY